MTEEVRGVPVVFFLSIADLIPPGGQHLHRSREPGVEGGLQMAQYIPGKQGLAIFPSPQPSHCLRRVAASLARQCDVQGCSAVAHKAKNGCGVFFSFSRRVCD